MAPNGSYTISRHSDIHEIDASAWNALAEPLPTPLLEWEWLARMEESKSVAPQAGWLPCHLCVWHSSTLVGAAPLYVKGHSAGEFVWDYVWADVASQLNVEYYPKLIGMSPATPAVGYRFLVSPDEDEAEITRILLETIDVICRENSFSGANFLFVDPEWQRSIEEYGYIAWAHQSYEWLNHGFESFDDYVAIFNKNQRKNIRRERRKMAEQGIRIETYNGDEIYEDLFPIMWRYYERTNDKFGPWAAKYLTPTFFDGLHETFRHRILFVAAYTEYEPDRPIALSFLLTKGDQLIGRYWGAEEDIDMLHFNLCYYTPIEWAIEHGIQRFDPGAGSPHKLRRGFYAVKNHSLHRFYDKTMHTVMATHIDEINGMEEERVAHMNDSLPVKEPYAASKIGR